MTDSHSERKYTKKEMFIFLQTCQAKFSAVLDELIHTAKVPTYGVMISLIGFAGEAAAQAGMPREDFFEGVRGRVRRGDEDSQEPAVLSNAQAATSMGRRPASRATL